MNASAETSRRSGFSLVELLVIVAIIALLVGILLPAAQAARSSARRIQCVDRLRQLGLAMNNYHGARRAFPQARDEKMWSWLTRLLPYMEQQSLHDQIDFSRTAWKNGRHQPATATIVPSFVCPADSGNQRISPHYPYAYTNYFGVAGTEGGGPPGWYRGYGVLPSSGYKEDPGPTISLERVTDGTSKTLLVGERPVIGVDINGNGDVGWWAAGLGYRISPYGRGEYILDSSEGLRKGVLGPTTLDNATHWWSHHSEGGHFAFVDGSVRLLNYDINHELLLALSTRNGHELMSERVIAD